MKRLGLFGGTFDPAHFGHLVPARRACEALALDALVFIPGARPPHKLGEPLTPFAHRFAMLALATQGTPHWFVSDVEQDRGGPTYTIDTLTEMARRTPAEATFFIMGSDSLAQITTWHRWRELVDMVHLVVLHRPGAWGEELRAAVPAPLAARTVVVGPAERAVGVPPEPRVFLVEHEPVPISATDLRARLRRGSSTRGLTPPEVARYAIKYHLYLQGDTHADGL